jgi:hypothetical protein
MSLFLCIYLTESCPISQFPYSQLITIFLNFVWGWSGIKSTITATVYYLSYQAWMTDVDDCGTFDGMKEWQGKPKYSEENGSSVALFTTDRI